MKKGFTLMELLFVVIIIGLLAALGLPQFFRATERARTAEGVRLLGSLRGAQFRYAAENGATTNDLNKLDVEYTGLKYFNTPTVVSGVNPRDSAQQDSVIASITRNDNQNAGFGNYTLYIQVDGDITCSGGARDTCSKLGY
jgi:prepilin-type N-terminal cleavage/methylation domain-containing protein